MTHHLQMLIYFLRDASQIFFLACHPAVIVILAVTPAGVFICALPISFNIKFSF